MSFLSWITTPGFLIGPVANAKWEKSAEKLRKSCDPELYAKRIADSANTARVMGKFYEVLLDSSDDLKFRGRAAGLKLAAQQGELKPGEGKLSIAVSGGGLRMIAFMAFFEVLREHNIPIHSYAGTSAGSLATLFDRAGMDYKHVWDVLDENLLKAIMLCPNFNISRGLLNGKRIMNFLDAALPERYKKYRDIPGLYTTGVAVNVWRDAAHKQDLSTYEKVVFSSEFDPSMPIPQGIFTSMCLPIFQSQDFPDREFSSIRGRKEVRFSLATGGGEAQYAFVKILTTANGRTIDGGYDNNYPVDIPLSLYEPARDVVINLVAVYPGKVEIPKERMWGKLINTPVDIRARDELVNDQIAYREANVIHWEIGNEIRDVGLMDWGKIKMMVDAGRKSAEEFLRKFGL